MLYYSHFVIASSVTTFRFLTDLQLLYLDAADSFLNSIMVAWILKRLIRNLAILHLSISSPSILNSLVLNPSIMGPSTICRRLCRLLPIRIISPLRSCR
jgi:hypothetical protein